MQEKIYEDSKHIGEDDYYQRIIDNNDTYEIFKRAIEEIAGSDESREEIIKSLKYELKRLEEELR